MIATLATTYQYAQELLEDCLIPVSEVLTSELTRDVHIDCVESGTGVEPPELVQLRTREGMIRVRRLQQNIFRSSWGRRGVVLVGLRASLYR